MTTPTWSQALPTSAPRCNRAWHSLTMPSTACSATLSRADLDPERLAALDERLVLWLQLARRYQAPATRTAPAAARLAAQSCASWTPQPTCAALRPGRASARRSYHARRKGVCAARNARQPSLARAITQAMQGLGMTGRPL